MWIWVLDQINDIQHFLGLGGSVLLVIFLLTFLLWILVIERYLYFWIFYPNLVNSFKSYWANREDKTSWYAKQIRREMISRMTLSNTHGLYLIKGFIALCPLLGLLGTVVGMVNVFDVLAVTGTGSPRAMASGISKATIPTMAGMVAALSGLFFSVRLESRARRATHSMADALKHD